MLDLIRLSVADLMVRALKRMGLRVLIVNDHTAAVTLDGVTMAVQVHVAERIEAGPVAVSILAAALHHVMEDETGRLQMRDAVVLATEGKALAPLADDIRTVYDQAFLERSLPDPAEVDGPAEQRAFEAAANAESVA